MKSRCAALGFVMLALACAPKRAPDDNGGRPGSLQGRLRAQTTTTMTATETGTATHTSTETGTATQTVTVTQTVTATATTTGSGTATVTQTVTATATTTAIQTGTVTATGTETVTFTGTRTGTAPGIYQQIYTFTGTITATSTGIVYYAAWPHSQGNTATATTNQFASGTGLTTVTRTVTSPFNGTETKTASTTVTGSGTKTGTATVTVTATVTTATTNAGTGTGTVTATGTATGTATQTWTATWTTQVTQTVTNTNTSTVTNTNTVSNTATLTNTSTLTQTTTETSSTTGTSTTTNTSTATSTNTTTRTTTNTNTDTVTTTVTRTTTETDTSTSVDGGVGDGGGSASCLQAWRDTTCGQSCMQETQWDRMHCTVFLDCYLEHNCGPDTCGADPDDICGVNKFTYGMAPKTIADQVHACLGCNSAAPPACAIVNVTASISSSSPPVVVEGSQAFPNPTTFPIPPLLTVTAGSAGNGTATLSFQVAGASPTCWRRCTYQGLASTSHPTTPEQIVLGRIYGFQSCDSGVNPALPVFITGLTLRINEADPLAGTTEVQLIVPCATDNLAPVTPVPEGVFDDSVGSELPPSPGMPHPTPADEPPIPDPYLSPTNPEVDGGYVPIANPELQLVEIPF
jgi:PKD repeat protein